MYALFAALGLFALGIAAGYRYRLCALLFFLGFTYVELLDKTANLNHYYWAALVSLMMVFLPLHRSLSVDAWLGSRTVWRKAPVGALSLLRAQLAAVYIFAGIANLNADWLVEARPLRIWLQDHAGLPMVGPLLSEVWAAYAFSWAGAFFDLSIIGWLIRRRTRPIACVALVVFHLMTYLFFPQIGVFPLLMSGAALLWAVHVAHCRHGQRLTVQDDHFQQLGADFRRAAIGSIQAVVLRFGAVFIRGNYRSYAQIAPERPCGLLLHRGLVGLPA